MVGWTDRWEMTKKIVEICVNPPANKPAIHSLSTGQETMMYKFNIVLKVENLKIITVPLTHHLMTISKSEIKTFRRCCVWSTRSSSFSVFGLTMLCFQNQVLLFLQVCYKLCFIATSKNPARWIISSAWQDNFYFIYIYPDVDIPFGTNTNDSSGFWKCTIYNMLK